MDKKLKDKEFIAQVESEEKKKKELIESVKKAKENKEKAEKIKKALSKKQTIANAKAKIAAALDKATKKKPPAPAPAPEPEPIPAAPVEPTIPSLAELPENAVSKSVYKRAIDGIL